MTKQQIIKTIKEVNNPSIKWSVLENTHKKIVLTNDYDKGIKHGGHQMIRLLLNALALLGVREAYRDSVDEGLVDFSGQGRNRYGE